jgi:hypothetical protein
VKTDLWLSIKTQIEGLEWLARSGKYRH